MLEQTICLQPHVGVPIAVEARFVSAAFILARQQITNSNGQSQHLRIVKMPIFGMAFGIEHGGREDGVREMFPARPSLERRQVRAGLSVERLSDFGGPGFHQPEISCGEFLGIGKSCRRGEP